MLLDGAKAAIGLRRKVLLLETQTHAMPMVWGLFASRLLLPAEAARDDLVLASGHEPCDYADHLLHIASGLRTGILSAHSSIAMARKSKLEGRLLAILDGRRNRRALTRWGLLIAAVRHTIRPRRDKH